MKRKMDKPHIAQAVVFIVFLTMLCALTIADLVWPERDIMIPWYWPVGTLVLMAGLGWFKFKWLAAFFPWFKGDGK